MKMTFFDKTTGKEFNPNCDVWPEYAYAKENYVELRIYREENHVVSEEPGLVWDLKEFLKYVNTCDGNLPKLLKKAINVPKDPEYDDAPIGFGKMSYYYWMHPGMNVAFQIAYFEKA